MARRLQQTGTFFTDGMGISPIDTKQATQIFNVASVPTVDDVKGRGTEKNKIKYRGQYNTDQHDGDRTAAIKRASADN